MILWKCLFPNRPHLQLPLRSTLENPFWIFLLRCPPKLPCPAALPSCPSKVPPLSCPPWKTASVRQNRLVTRVFTASSSWLCFYSSLSQAAPISLRSAKAAINQGLETDLAGGMKVEEQQYVKVTTVTMTAVNVTSL